MSEEEEDEEVHEEGKGRSGASVVGDRTLGTLDASRRIPSPPPPPPPPAPPPAKVLAVATEEEEEEEEEEETCAVDAALTAASPLEADLVAVIVSLRGLKAGRVSAASPATPFVPRGDAESRDGGDGDIVAGAV